MKKKYAKAQIVAKNKATGSYAAGCPEKNMGISWISGCKACERTK